MFEVFLWKHLSSDQIDSLEASFDPENIKKFILF